LPNWRRSTLDAVRDVALIDEINALLEVKMRAGEAATSPRWPGIHAFIEAELAANAAEPVTPLPQSEEAGLDAFLCETVLRFDRLLHRLYRSAKEAAHDRTRRFPRRGRWPDPAHQPRAVGGHGPAPGHREDPRGPRQARPDAPAPRVRECRAEISGAQVDGAELGSQSLRFVPGPVRAGDYRFAIASAGSCMLVLQTVLPPLLLAGGRARCT
jgi:hypothetical protein